MQVDVVAGAVQEVATELIVVSLLEGSTQSGGAAVALDAALGGAIGDVLRSGDFKGKAEQSLLLYSHGSLPARRVLVMGLGKADKLDLDVVRRVAAAAAREVKKLGVTRFHSVVHGVEAAGLDRAAAAQAVVEGTLLGTYAFERYKTQEPETTPALAGLTLVEGDAEKAQVTQGGAAAGQIVADSVCLARDLANQPANYMTPTLLAEMAERVAQEVGLRCQVLDEAQMAELGMGALLGVARGSAEPAKFIVLEHQPERDDLETYVVVGKGITFDSGGISLKPSDGLAGMKFDMSGAAAALGILRSVALLKLPLHVVGLIPATENLPDGKAYKPSDVLHSMAGLTIEIISTDAEGRLILADALAYARRYQPKAVVDLATLTGACAVALGNIAAGLMGNDPATLAALKAASAQTGEKVWELPLYEEYGELIKSDVADVKNAGPRGAGAITAGLFLSRFASDYPWAHIDIAGTATTDSTSGYTIKGCTGYGVRLLVQWLRQAAQG